MTPVVSEAELSLMDDTRARQPKAVRHPLAAAKAGARTARAGVSAPDELQQSAEHPWIDSPSWAKAKLDARSG